jgi:hypothetical protein
MTAILGHALALAMWSLASASWVPERRSLPVDPGSGAATATVEVGGCPVESRRRRWLARRITSPPVLLTAAP